MIKRPLVLVQVQHTLASNTWSGVQRVVGKLAQKLPAVADVEFVKWDRDDGQLRYLDRRDLCSLFPGAQVPAEIRPNPYAHRVNYRFGDTLPQRPGIWFLFPEIPYHIDNGTEIMTRAITMCREYGVKSASLFYDAIPVTNVNYRALRAQHSRYLAQLSRVDRIFAISRHSKSELEEVYKTYVGNHAQFEDLCTRIVTAPLGEADTDVAPTTRDDARGDKILVLGTIEPRKRQLQVLRAFRERLSGRGIQTHLIGSLHPDVASEFHSLVASSNDIYYHGYAPADQVARLFNEAIFSVFASDDEGFGLPIVESLAHGVPCLTANFGASAELAEGGGCLTVDVRDSAQLADAMARLVEDGALLQRLQREIRLRRRRTWEDYARQLAEDMCAVSSAERALERGLESEIADAVAAGLATGMPVSRVYQLQPGATAACANLIIDVAGGAAASNTTGLANDARYEARIVLGGLTPSRPSTTCGTTGAVAWVCQAEDALDAWICEANRGGSRGMLPPICIVERDQTKLIARASQSVTRHLSDLCRRRRIASREELLRALTERWPEASSSSPLLTIVISTFNRARFVQENVRWLLSVLSKFPEDIRLTVIDNASTDDTLKRLAEFTGVPRLTIISNPVNVGMLGNLRVCSALVQSRYVWLTGDDDFIVPAGLAEVTNILRRHPELPAVVTNFGVYHRAELAPTDTAKKLIADRRPLAADPSPSGFYSVARLAEEHDNLFTAVYPLVFRSDLLAACFNYPFDRKPFVDLVESVPTTKLLLQTYASTTVYWCAGIGIVGNLSNSWGAHRPRWHGVLMPQILRLAREVGVNTFKLQEWSTIHLKLFEEAKRWALSRDVALDVSQEELRESALVFRQPMTVN